MLYLIMTEHSKYDETVYTIFESHTESRIRVSRKVLANMLTSHKMESKNMHITKGKVQIKEWPHPITNSSTFNQDTGLTNVLIGKLSEQEFKIINGLGHSQYIDEFKLQRLISLNRVANCSYDYGTTALEKIYKSIDTCNLETNPKFKKSINDKYAQFTAKACLLGMNIAFEYTIENEDVKITKYTGTSKRVIIPKFITTICTFAFEEQGIEELTLTNGLINIGNYAFKNNKIKTVEIPKTVKFVGLGAFESWANRKENNCEVVKLNNNTLILEEEMLIKTLRRR